MEKCYKGHSWQNWQSWQSWHKWRNWNNWNNWSNCYNWINRDKTKIDYSLYLVTDDKFLRNRKNVCDHFLNKIIESVLGGVSLVQIRLKKVDDLYFYNMIIQAKQKLRPFNIPIIINDRVDMCLGTDSDGVHLGRLDLPLHVAKRIIKDKKFIGATINFSNEQDVAAAINNNLNYIVHEETLYASKTKKTEVANILKMKQQLKMLNIIFLNLKEKRKINQHAILPPKVLIGGINENTIEETMKLFHDTYAGFSVVSALMGNIGNPFLNALKLKLIIDKYKQEEHIALLNMFNSCLNYSLYTLLTGRENEMENCADKKKKKVIDTRQVERYEEEKEEGNEKIDWTNYSYACTYIPLNEYICDSLLQKIKVVHIKDSFSVMELINFYLFDSKCIYLGENGGITITNNLTGESIMSKWIKEMKKKNIKNKVFICVGQETLHYFIKEFLPDSFHFLFFIVMENTCSKQNSISQLPQFQSLGEYNTKQFSIKYCPKFIYINLKTPFFFNERKCINVAVWLLWLLHTHNMITQQLLSKIVGDITESIELNLLKRLSAAITAIIYTQKEDHIKNLL